MATDPTTRCTAEREGATCTLARHHDGEHDGVTDYKARLRWTNFGPGRRTPEPATTTEATTTETTTTPTAYVPQVGDRVRVIHEGTVTVSEGGYVQVRTSPDDTRTFALATVTTVERLRPGVPTGLGAVVRLDGPDGPLAIKVKPHAWDIVGVHELAERIVDVLSQGVELP